MVTEAELAGRLREFLSTSDLNTTTTAIVRRKLEEDFGIDLSDKKAFIREQVDLYLQSQLEEQQNEEEEEEEDNDEAEEDGEAAADVGGADEDEESEHSTDGKAAPNKRSKKKNKEVKKRGGGFTKLCSLSPELQKFTGVSELARTEVVKQLWQYIREHNLQDPSNRRNINCDDTLRDLFGVDTINMFQMNKALTKHIWPLDSGGASMNSSTNSISPQKEKRQKQDREEGMDELKRQEKRQKSGNSGILAPLPLSDALVRFLGTGETALPRSDVIKKIWRYIKQNNLQDPSDKRRIICDQKLKELFNVDTFNGFSVAKFLTAHFIKSEQ